MSRIQLTSPRSATPTWRPHAERFGGDLVAATKVALCPGWACRAVNAHVPGDNERTFTRLRMFLDGRP